jgi:hypothetical protein
MQNETTPAVRLWERLPSPVVNHVAAIIDAWRSVGDHAGIVVSCDGDDAAETWNRLCRLLDPLVESQTDAE